MALDPILTTTWDQPLPIPNTWLTAVQDALGDLDEVSITKTERDVPSMIGTVAKEIGKFTVAEGTHLAFFGVTVDAAGFSSSALYCLPAGHNATLGAWQLLKPIASAQDYLGDHFLIDVNGDGDDLFLRLRRGGGSTAGTATIAFFNLGLTTDVFTSLLGTSSGITPPTDVYAATLVEQRGGDVRIWGADGSAVARVTEDGLRLGDHSAPTKRLDVPWKSGDMLDTASFGATTVGNAKTAVAASSNSGIAVEASSTSGNAVFAESDTSVALYGRSYNEAAAGKFERKNAGAAELFVVEDKNGSSTGNLVNLRNDGSGDKIQFWDGASDCRCKMDDDGKMILYGGSGEVAPDCRLHILDSDEVSIAASAETALAVESDADCSIEMLGRSSKYQALNFSTDVTAKAAAISRPIGSEDLVFRAGHDNRWVIESGGTLRPEDNCLYEIGTAARIVKEAYIHHVTTGGCDYAELFEASPEVAATGRIAPGTSVVLDGGFIRPALPGETPIGVISHTHSTLGNAPGSWRGRYIKDDDGTCLWEEYQSEIMRQKTELVPAVIKRRPVSEAVEVQVERIVLEEGRYVRRAVTETEKRVVLEEHDLYDEGGEIVGTHRVAVLEEYEAAPAKRRVVCDADGEPVLEGTGEFETKRRRVANPEYDETKEYAQRQDRDEWNPVGLLGCLWLIPGQPTAPTWTLIKDGTADTPGGKELWLIR